MLTIGSVLPSTAPPQDAPPRPTARPRLACCTDGRRRHPVGRGRSGRARAGSRARVPAANRHHHHQPDRNLLGEGERNVGEIAHRL